MYIPSTSLSVSGYQCLHFPACFAISTMSYSRSDLVDSPFKTDTFKSYMYLLFCARFGIQYMYMQGLTPSPNYTSLKDTIFNSKLQNTFINLFLSFKTITPVTIASWSYGHGALPVAAASDGSWSSWKRQTTVLILCPSNFPASNCGFLDEIDKQS